jgi:hypothetical protein
MPKATHVGASYAGVTTSPTEAQYAHALAHHGIEAFRDFDASVLATRAQQYGQDSVEADLNRFKGLTDPDLILWILTEGESL